MPEESTLTHALEQIDRLVERIEQLSDADLRRDMQELVQCLLDYHGAAIARLIHLIGSQGGGAQLVEQLASDELVGSLLLLYECHPADFAARVEEALSRVRPFLGTHHGDVELVDIADGVVRLRLLGNCHGCPSSSATMKARVEEAIFAAAPETARIELVDDDTPRANGNGNGFVSIEELAHK